MELVIIPEAQGCALLAKYISWPERENVGEYSTRSVEIRPGSKVKISLDPFRILITMTRGMTRIKIPNMIKSLFMKRIYCLEIMSRAR
jgi:hypothetical protein